jgi:hypothetical protein
LEDLELVLEHDGLKIQLIEATADEQAEQPVQKPVSDGPEHLGSLMPGWPACQRPGRSGRSSFFTPQAHQRVSLERGVTRLCVLEPDRLSDIGRFRGVSKQRVCQLFAETYVLVTDRYAPFSLAE